MGYLYFCLNCGNIQELKRKRKVVVCNTCQTVMSLRYKTIKMKNKNGNFVKLIQTLPLVEE